MSIGSYATQFINQLQTGDEIRDWRHASKLFVDGLYRLGPKTNNLFHVFVDLAPEVIAQQPIPITTAEIGMMAKTVNLPKFTVQNKIYNAYNRKSIAQERIAYDPVTIVFHDDQSNIVRNFWFGYYNYYYRDANNSEQQFDVPVKYKPMNNFNWGYSPNSPTTVNYIKAIRIYCLHLKQYSAYYLVRPTITSFGHGEVANGETGLLEHTMSVAYEAVLYAAGPVGDGELAKSGFGSLHYDTASSPLTSVGGGTTSIAGPGGLIDSAGSFIENIQSGNYLGAALGALRTEHNFHGVSIGDVVSSEASQIGMNILRGQNPTTTVFVPTIQSVQTGLARAIGLRPKTTLPLGATPPFAP